MRLHTAFTAILLLAPASMQAAAPLWDAAFDRVWTTIREKHWDPEKTGPAWDRARADLLPKLAAAQTDAEARAVVQELLASLGQSHFGVIPKQSYEAWAESGQENDADAGIEVRMLGGVPVVTRVQPGSPGAESGVQPGWALMSAGEKPLAPRLEKQGRLAQWMIATRALHGRAGEVRRFEFESAGGKRHAIPLTLRPAPGRIVKFGNLPPLAMQLERTKLDGGAQYLRWNAFFEPEWLNTELKQAIAECGACPGLVLDLRGNLGGIAALAATVTGWLVDRQEPIGTVISRSGQLKLVSFPRPGAFGGPVAVLTDELSISTAEFLAAGLKDLGRARLFGATTQGAALPSVVEKLPTGDGFQYATADYVSRSGARVEGSGVRPDVEVPLRRTDLVMGRDAVLDAALQWLQQESNNRATKPKEQK